MQQYIGALVLVFRGGYPSGSPGHLCFSLCPPSSRSRPVWCALHMQISMARPTSPSSSPFAPLFLHSLSLPLGSGLLLNDMHLAGQRGERSVCLDPDLRSATITNEHTLKWLAQELGDVMKATKLYTGYKWLANYIVNKGLVKYLEWVLGRLNKFFNSLYRASVSVRQNVSTTSLENGPMNSDPCGMSMNELPFSDSTFREPSLLHARTLSISSVRSPVAVAPSTPSIDEIAAMNDTKTVLNTSLPVDRDGEFRSTSNSPGHKFKAVAQKVVRLNRGLPLGPVLAPGPLFAASPPGSPTVSQEVPGSPSSFNNLRLDSVDSIKTKFRPSRLTTIVPALRALRTTQYLSEHTALVRHLQFSPNGEFCAYIISSPKVTIYGCYSTAVSCNVLLGPDGNYMEGWQSISGPSQIGTCERFRGPGSLVPGWQIPAHQGQFGLR